MLKCADIGHGAKTLELHKKWSRRIIEEFYRQGDNEIKHNLPISPLNDRKNSVSKSQEGFLVHIVLPLYEALNPIQKVIIPFDFSPDFQKKCVDQIRSNIIFWTDLYEVEKELGEEEEEHPFMRDTRAILLEISEEGESDNDNNSTHSWHNC